MGKERSKMEQKIKTKSIRSKIVVAFIIFSVVPVLIVTMVAFYITSETLKEQLIFNRRMSTTWLQERLVLELENTRNQLYEYEVNKNIKADILTWQSPKGLDYKTRLRLISAMNTTISMDSNINGIEIYNLIDNTVLVANRAGVSLEQTENKLSDWEHRDKSLQRNIVYLRSDNEILTFHQINRFKDGKALALVVIRQRQYKLQEILADIKMTNQESVFILNDENQLIEADYGKNVNYSNEYMKKVLNKLEGSQSSEITYEDNFWFYRTVRGGKLKILMAVPNKVIVSATEKTVYGGIIVAIIAAFVSISCSAIFSNKITKPIIKLSNKMRNFTIGDRTKLRTKKRQDEIGVLEESFSLMVKRNEELITQQFQAKLEKRNAQLRALQAQINPHFMYNTLQVIGGMAIRQGIKEINFITTALSDILRYSLNFSKEMVCVRDEVFYLKSYLTIQNERFGNRIHLKVDVPVELEDYLIPKLILQPMLENSFKHGLPEKIGDWNIEVIGHLNEEGDLELISKDNGIGIKKERLEELQEMLARDAETALGVGSHIGLCNVNARIRIRYPGGKYGVRIQSEEGKGTTVTVLLKAVREEGGQWDIL